jgi:uncharacterized protein YaaQ
MKLILAIVNNDDSSTVLHHITNKGFFATKLATTGGFLKAGNTTFIIGTEDERVETALSIIEKYSKKRIQSVPSAEGLDIGVFAPVPIDVSIGGATVFIMDVGRYEKY